MAGARDRSFPSRNSNFNTGAGIGVSRCFVSQARDFTVGQQRSTDWAGSDGVSYSNSSPSMDSVIINWMIRWSLTHSCKKTFVRCFTISTIGTTTTRSPIGSATATPRPSSKADGLDYRCMRLGADELKLMKRLPQIMRWRLTRPFIRRLYRRQLGAVSHIGIISGLFFDDVGCMQAGVYLLRFWLELARHDLYIHPFGNLVTNRAGQSPAGQLHGHRRSVAGVSHRPHQRAAGAVSGDLFTRCFSMIERHSARHFFVDPTRGEASCCKASLVCLRCLPRRFVSRHLHG